MAGCVRQVVDRMVGVGGTVAETMAERGTSVKYRRFFPDATWITSVIRRPAFSLCVVLVVYGALLLPTLHRQGISWDEQTDLDIARSYLLRPDGWLRGSPSDPSQTRLPMAVVAVVYAALGTEDLLTARIVSCLAGGLTIAGVVVFCRRDFDSKRGLIAGLMLATSPFFLSFAKTAFTETDIYVACAFVWLLVAMSRLRETGTVGWAAITAGVLGLALSGKFTTLVVFPAIVIHLRSFVGDPGAETLSRRDIVRGAGLLVLMGAAMALGWFTLSAMGPDGREDALLRLHFLLAFGGWIAVLVWAARHRDKIVSPQLTAVFILVLALGTFMVLPPVHTTNPDILDSLVDRLKHEMRGDPAFFAEAAVLHLGSVLFKSSPLVGLGLLVSPVAVALQWRARPGVRFPLLLLGFYVLGLLLLPLAQTFYMIPVLPILAILTADQLLTLAARRRALALALGALAAVGLGVDLALCYPDYNLNGYQYLGARYLGGRSTIGYRSIVQTTSDGVQQIGLWLNDHARYGDRVVVYVNPWHILEATCPDPAFRLVPGDAMSVRLRPDYVVIHINATLRSRWAGSFSDPARHIREGSVWWEPYDAAWLHAHFTKVATVRRAFGLEMASVWERDGRVRRE
ncbi:MAG: glycosyltransferase family 39 protein [Anaerolineae bacterium]|nr:glycosyltransferase family 39 protein [Anaerolineae bacterium]